MYRCLLFAVFLLGVHISYSLYKNFCVVQTTISFCLLYNNYKLVNNIHISEYHSYYLTYLLYLTNTTYITYFI